MENHPTELINKKVIEECHHLLDSISCCPSNYKLVRSLRVIIRRFSQIQFKPGEKQSAKFRLEVKKE